MPLFIFLRFFIIFLLTFSALNVTIKLTGYHTKKIPVSTRGEIPMNRFLKAMAAVASAAALTVSGAGSSFSAVLTSPAATANAVDDGNDDWLHAEGSRLYDMNGNEVWLTGANWFGLNCVEGAPHYLWSADCDDLLREVADRGINVIRFPISTQRLMEWMSGEPKQLSGGGMQASYNPPKDEDDGNGGVIKAGTYGSINKDFVGPDGKTLIDELSAFDIILGKCKKYGIKAFIDIHSPHTDNSGHNYNLWYGKAGVTTEDWIETLTWMAERYKNDDTLIGFDLKNEPHGKGQEGKDAAKWDGSKDENNWAYAATRCAESILDVNPNALIFIEGVEQSMSGAMEGDYWGMPDRKDNSPYIGAWWGGNFRGARKYPIKPKQGTSQIVYSPHDYGPSVYAQTWFDKDFDTNSLLKDYWYDTWAYINAENIAPELIGEWGGHMDGGKNQKWMTLLRDYMIKNHINHTFWCLNTNSGDTGGLWKSFSYSIGDVSDTSNGTTIIWEEDKYALMEKALWQTASSGKYIGLDHQRPLGINGTGVSLNEFYTKYASTEGSNLDGGKKGNGTPINVEPGSTTTTAPKATTTTTIKTTTTTSATETKPTTTSTEKTTSSTSTIYTTTVSSSSTDTPDSIRYGDANLDENVTVADAVAILQYIGNKDKYKLSDKAKKNADCCNPGDGITGQDALAIQKLDAKIYTELPAYTDSRIN